MKARAEALKDNPPRAKHENKEDEEEDLKPSRRLSPGRTSQPKKNVMQKGESISDFFARD